MKITTVGIDLAKNVVQVHGADERDKVMAFFANMESCVIGMQACGSAHHWARQLQSLGHEVKLILVLFCVHLASFDISRESGNRRANRAASRMVASQSGRTELHYLARYPRGEGW